MTGDKKMRKSLKKVLLVISIVMIMTITVYAADEKKGSRVEGSYKMTWCDVVHWSGFFNCDPDLGAETIDDSSKHELYTYVSYRALNDGILVKTNTKSSANMYVMIVDNNFADSADKIYFVHRIYKKSTGLAKVTKSIVMND